MTHASTDSSYLLCSPTRTQPRKRLASFLLDVVAESNHLTLSLLRSQLVVLPKERERCAPVLACFSTESLRYPLAYHQLSTPWHGRHRYIIRIFLSWTFQEVCLEYLTAPDTAHVPILKPPMTCQGDSSLSSMTAGGPLQVTPLVYDSIVSSSAAIYGSLIALTILAYDVILTIDQEVDVIWRAKWTLPKGLYILSRYLGLSGMIANTIEIARPHISDHVCHTSYLIRYLSLALSAAAVEGILMVRIYAIYRQNRIVLGIVFTLAIISGGLSVVILTIFLRSLKAVSLVTAMRDFPLALPGCRMRNTQFSSLAKWFWVPLVTFEIVLFVLMAMKYLSSIRGPLKEVGKLQQRTSLFVTFFRDGTVYFTIIAASLFFKIIIQELPSLPPGMSLVTGWTPVIFSITGPRLVLNLRSLSLKEHREQYAVATGQQMRVESAFVAAQNRRFSLASVSSLDTQLEERETAEYRMQPAYAAV